MVSARLFLAPLAARASVAFLDTDTYNLEDKRYHLPSNPCVCNKWRRIPASPGARFGARFGAWQARAPGSPLPSRHEFYGLGGEQTDPPSVQWRLSAYRAETCILDR